MCTVGSDLISRVLVCSKIVHISKFEETKRAAHAPTEWDRNENLYPLSDRKFNTFHNKMNVRDDLHSD